MFDLHTDKLYFTFVFKYRTRVTHKSMQRHSSLWTRTRSSSLDNDRIASTIDAKDCYWLRCSISFSHILQQTLEGINSTWAEIIQPLSDMQITLLLPVLLYTSRYTPNAFLPMNASSNLRLNGLGGVYSAGKAFPEAKWAEILIRYTNIILDEDQCSARCLSNECCISRGSASKVILYAEIGMLPPSLKQGNGRVGVGSMCGFTMEHHLYIYHLYQRNPSRQLLGYVKKIKKKIEITISEGFMSRWFKTIGPFKGTLRLRKWGIYLTKIIKYYKLKVESWKLNEFNKIIWNKFLVWMNSLMWSTIGHVFNPCSTTLYSMNYSPSST